MPHCGLIQSAVVTDSALFGCRSGKESQQERLLILARKRLYAVLQSSFIIPITSFKLNTGSLFALVWPFIFHTFSGFTGQGYANVVWYCSWTECQNLVQEDVVCLYVKADLYFAWGEITTIRQLQYYYYYYCYITILLLYFYHSLAPPPHRGRVTGR